MKLNFEYCKTCNGNGRFITYCGGLNFYCSNCGHIVFESKGYKTEKFHTWIYLNDVTEEELIDINQMNIVKYNPKFNNCPYRLEHILDEKS